MTPKELIEEKIKKIVAEGIGCKINDVKNDSRLVEDLSADSLDIVELVMEIERGLDIDIPDLDIAIMHGEESPEGFCVQNLIDVALKQIEAKK